MSISLRRLSISNEVANHPIRQNQDCEPCGEENGTTAGVAGGQSVGTEGGGRRCCWRTDLSQLLLGALFCISSFHLYHLTSPFCWFCLFFARPLLATPLSLTSSTALVHFSACGENVHSDWRCNEKFKSSHKAGGAVICILLLCKQHCAAVERWWQRKKGGKDQQRD